MLILVVAGLLGRPFIGLAVVATLATATAVQRMIWTMGHLDARA